MKCPNCSGEIGRFELSPNCKHCGVNIYYSQQKKFLTDDAKMCELEYASFHILVAKLKAAFVRGALPRLRIVAMVVAIASIFVPFATVSTQLPLISSELSFGAWGIYSAFSDGTLFAMMDLYKYAPLQVGVSLLLLLLIVLIFLAGLGIFLCLVLSFLNIQKTARIMRGFSVAGAIFCMCAAATSIYIPFAMGKGGFLAGSTGVGAFGCLLVFIFIFMLNHLVIKKNLQPDIKEVDLLRVEMKKKVKSGEVSLDELSLPIYESEEEKAKRLEEEEKKNALVQAGKGEGSNE